jgi:hypothetical protein
VLSMNFFICNAAVKYKECVAALVVYFFVIKICCIIFGVQQ